jgi:hypothetical protein
MLLLKLPWSSRVWALPFLTVLCRAQVEGQTAKVWHTQRRRKSKKKSKAQVKTKAALPKSTPRQHKTAWEETEVSWYGGQKKKLLMFSRTALWHTPGEAPVKIRYVITRDPAGKLRDEVFACTKLDATPAQIIEWVVMRWSVETTFEEAREHLGMETQRQWSDLAIGRTTPCLLGLFSLVVLLTHRLRPEGQVPALTAAWYAKPEATFSDCLILVRKHLWRSLNYVNSAPRMAFAQLCELCPASRVG